MQSALRTVTVASTGSAPLAVGAVSLVGPDPDEFKIVRDTCTNQPVAVGSSCAVDVAFLATKVQASLAHLDIPSNDPLTPFQVDLGGTGYGGVAQVSPTVDEGDGYPDWYQDERGIRLAQCIDPADPYCIVLPDETYDPAKPIHFLDNFPGEFFYTVADSEQVPLPDCDGNLTGFGFVRSALEGAFANALPADGEQIVFGRVRVRLRGVCPDTTYTVVHPYGTVDVKADADGRLTDTVDIGCLAAPCDFADAVLSPVLGGVLRWDPDKGAVAPAGYLGDGASLHRVVGAPYVEPGQGVPANYFKVYRDGALVGETNLFSVMGKLAGPLVADPPSASFGDVEQGASSTQTLTLHNEGVDPLTVDGLSTAGAQAADYTVDAGADHCTGTVLAPKATCTVDLVFSPLGTGARTASLRVDHTGMNNPLSVPLQGVGLAGGGLAALSVDRGDLTFEQLQVGRLSASQTVTVSNVGGSAPLVLDSVTLGGTDAGDFSVTDGTCTADVAPGETCVMTVTFTPTQAGHRTATLQVSAANAQPAMVSVGLAGDGASGSAAVSSRLRPSDGFPAWYQDANGVRLEPCLDPADPRCVVLPDAGFDPGLPLSFPDNYPPELFYALADSEVVPTTGCDGGQAGTAMLRLALEGSFAGTTAQAGQQVVFGRVRITADGLCPGTTYTFTTPYGPVEASADASGVVKDTNDIGCGGAPCAFDGALQSPVLGGFVRWAPGAGAAAPAGYLGDGVSYHRIVGGTYADPTTGEPVNHFEVTALDGTTVARTDKFLVSGKLASGLVADAVDFGDQPVLSTTTRDVTFTNIGTQPVTVAGSAIVGPDRSSFTDTGAGTCAGATLQADASCTVRLGFRPTDAVGYAATVQALGSGGAVLGTAGVTGHGLAASSPRASVPAGTSLDFGSQAVGFTATRTVTVTNAGDATLEVGGPTFSGAAAADYKATPRAGCGSVAPGATCVIDVAFTPSTTGTRSATMTILEQRPGTRADRRRDRCREQCRPRPQVAGPRPRQAEGRPQHDEEHDGVELGHVTAARLGRRRGQHRRLQRQPGQLHVTRGAGPKLQHLGDVQGDRCPRDAVRVGDVHQQRGQQAGAEGDGHGRLTRSDQRGRCRPHPPWGGIVRLSGASDSHGWFRPPTGLLRFGGPPPLHLWLQIPDGEGDRGGMPSGGPAASEGVSPMLSITLFGTTSATQEADGTEFTDFGGVKPRQILEILALAAGTPVPKDRLADLLWDGAPPRSYVGTLESYVCVLRRRLGCARGRAAAITTTSNGYLLDPRQVRVDLTTCRVLFAQAAASSPRTALQLVDDALALADGPLLASEPYLGWASREREVFTRELVIACTKASRHALDLGKHERAVELARTAVQHDRFAEEAWQQLIKALRACERKGEALRAYLDLRAVMVDELGVEPGPASHALYLEVLREEPTRSAADHDGHMEVRTLLGLLRQALESVPGVDVPKGDGALAAVAAQLVGVA